MCGNDPCETCKQNACDKQILDPYAGIDYTTVAQMQQDLQPIQTQNVDLQLNLKQTIQSFEQTTTFTYDGPELYPEDLKKKIEQDLKNTGWYDWPVITDPNPQPSNIYSEVADFVFPQDKMLVWLACQMYKVLPVEIPGGILYPKFTNSQIGVWTGCSVAYVAFRGTVSPEIADMKDDLIIATSASCELSITKIGAYVIKELRSMGYEIHLCGHSLGGRAALCLGSMPGVTKVVVINAAAPLTSPVSIGPGENIATHYHIFGDIISSHQISGAKIYRIRVGFDQIQQRKKKLLGDPELYEADWLSTFYHTTLRFLEKDFWNYATPQEEQNSLENYFFNSRRADLETLSLMTSPLGFQFASSLKTMICANVIPGAVRGINCEIEESLGQKILNTIMNVLGLLTGTALGFLGAIEKVVMFDFGGAADAIIFGPVAGYEASRGNLGPLFSLLIPGWGKITLAAKIFIYAVVDIVQKSVGETLQNAITRAVVYLFISRAPREVVKMFGA